MLTNNILKWAQFSRNKMAREQPWTTGQRWKKNLIITLDLEERIQLYKREVKTKMWILPSQDWKSQLGERYKYKKNYYNDLRKV